MTDKAADLIAKLNAELSRLCDTGTEASVTVQRIPVVGWRYLKPVLKLTTKPGRPL